VQPNHTGQAASATPGGGVSADEPRRPAAGREERILILAPAPSDASAISAAATEGGFTAEIVADMTSLCAAIGEGAGATVIVDAALSPAELGALREVLQAQPTWSDLPILLVLADVERDEARPRMRRLVELLQPAGNVHLLERPLEGWMLVTRFTAALRTRRRQYAARALLEQLDLERRRELAVLAALPVGIIVVDAGGRLVETNAAAHRIWGAMPVTQGAEDFRVLKAWRPGAAPEGKPFEWRFSQVLVTGQPRIEEELEIEAFDGVRRTVLTSALPIRGAGGEVAGAVSVQVDVTERARAEQARRILSEVTAALIESLDPDVTLRTLARIVVKHLADVCAIDETDERGELRRLVAETSGAASADEAARLLAFAPTATGNSLAARVLRSGKPILVSEVPGDWDWLARGPEADEHRAAFAKIGVCSLMALPLVARGRPLGVLGIVSTRPDRHYQARHLVLAEEISRRAAVALDNARLHRQAEAALRARSEALAEVDAFLNASPMGFALLDRELRFRRVNPVCASWYKTAPDEILGRAYEDVAPPEFVAQAAPLLRRVLQTGGSIVDQAIVGEIPSGSGKVKHHLNSFTPVLDVDGTPREVGVVVADVTRLKEAEAALREESVFRERFIGVLAHDLRSPLAAVALSAGSLLQHGDAPATWVRTVGRIAHAADRMGRMIGNLLDLARCREGGGIRLTRKPIDLASLVRDVACELETSHPGREIAVSGTGDTRAELDPDRMAQVVSNLAGNALAYSPAESVVRVEVDGREGVLVLAVRNAGAPIPPAAQKTIFLPFQRGAAPGCGPPAMRGLGLGLYIVGEITRAHGGTIAVSSTAEEGTTFTVRVPRAGAAADAALPDRAA
jgi:PAS domain S-box-containing protein